MAHSMLHYSVGLAAGTMIMLPPVLRSMTAGRGIARAAGIWLLTAHFCGIWAVIPGILRSAGLDPAVCEGWWMNLFFLHPMINQLKQGGMLYGGILVFACVALQYVLLLESILVVKRGASPTSAP